MKSKYAILALALVLAGTGIFYACSKGTGTMGNGNGGNGGNGSNGGGNSSSITIAGFAFSSTAITIAAGTTVTWTNKDMVAHTVTDNAGSFTSGDILPGATFSHTFNTVGIVNYHCIHHTYMTGKVTVQ